MRKERLYPPLAALNSLESQFRGLYEVYEDSIQRELGKLTKTDIAFVTAEFFLSTVNNIPIERLDKKEVLELMRLIITHCEWKKNKQVYTFSQVLFDMISEIEEFELDEHIFKYLPYPSFYLELPKNKLYHGVFTTYISDSISNALLFVILFNDGQYCIIPINLKRYSNTSQFMNQVDFIGVDKSDVKRILYFSLQACMYLCAKNCDVVENESQKGIYRPTVSHSNRYSEIRKWDVGFRFFREQQNSYHMIHKTQEGKTERNRPRQHWRKAHWHTYWVGQGRSRKELKFIAPILVNDNADEMPVVIHGGD